MGRKPSLSLETEEFFRLYIWQKRSTTTEHCRRCCRLGISCILLQCVQMFVEVFLSFLSLSFCLELRAAAYGSTAAAAAAVGAKKCRIPFFSKKETGLLLLLVLFFYIHTSYFRHFTENDKLTVESEKKTMF